MSEPNDVNHNIAVPGEWAIKKTFGPVLGEMGEDIRRLYAVRRDKIIAAAYGKIDDPDDGKTANVRVARDVMWNGAIADDEVCAEYFGGILASSRSEGGKDDSNICFVDVIKALSSTQLRLHYLIYNSFNKILVAMNKPINVGLSEELSAYTIWLAALELEDRHGIRVDVDLNLLYRQGLIREYAHNNFIDGDRVLPYCHSKQTTSGIMLYAAVHNLLDNWQSFSEVDFGNFDTIPSLHVFALSANELKTLAGFPVKEKKTPAAKSPPTPPQ